MTFPGFATLESLELPQGDIIARLDAMRAQTRFVLSLADADVRRRHPDWSDSEVRRASAKRWLSPDDYGRDILGIVRIRGHELDTAHLTRWAPHLRIPEDQLRRALDLASPPIRIH